MDFCFLLKIWVEILVKNISKNLSSKYSHYDCCVSKKKNFQPESRILSILNLIIEWLDATISVEVKKLKLCYLNRYQ